MSRPNPSDEHAAWLADEARLADDAWMRRLARGLVGDPHTADDLAQEAWLASLSESAARSRAWLAGVARNAWRDLRRSEGRRRRREHHVAREERAPDDAELVAELELRREVAERLLALPEPYRHTLWLRYFRDCSLRAIAEREGVPVSTVDSRVRRGLALLREALDRSRGGRRDAWAALLVPLVRRPAAGAVAAVGTTVTIGGIAMSTGTKIAAALALAGGLLGWWWTERGDGGAVDLVVPALAAAAPGADEQREPEPLVAATPQRERSSVAAAQPEVEAVAAPAPAPAGLVRGRVVESDGTPVPFARVAWTADDGMPIGTPLASDGEGRFELVAPHGGPHSKRGSRSTHSRAASLGIACADRDRTTLVLGAEGPDGERIVVVAPRAVVAGIVVDAGGAPVEGASVTLRLRQSLYNARAVVRPLDGASSEERDGWSTITDHGGTFELPGVCGGPHVFLQVRADGFQTVDVDVPPSGDGELVVTLRPAEEGVRLVGTVLDPRGRPFPGALVAAGMDITKSDQDGRFTLVWHPSGVDEVSARAPVALVPHLDTSRLIALAPKHRPAVVALEHVDPTAPLFLQLGAEPLAIAGRVVDEHGKPRADVVVWPLDPTPFGIEDRSQGESVARMAVSAEETLRGGFGERGAKTDADGRFVLADLLDRTYDLALLHPATATSGRADDVAAGRADVELVLRSEPATERVAGRIVSPSGVPLGGVSVTPQRPGGDDPNSMPPVAAYTLGTVRTDADGRFEFPELATQGTELQLQDEARIFFRTVRLADHADPGDLVLVEPILCELQVELGAQPGLADRLQVLDAAGEPLALLESYGAFFSFGPHARIENGRSGVLRVPETGRTLLLELDGEEVARRSIELDVEARLTVRL